MKPSLMRRRTLVRPLARSRLRSFVENHLFEQAEAAVELVRPLGRRVNIYRCEMVQRFALPNRLDLLISLLDRAFVT